MRNVAVGGERQRVLNIPLLMEVHEYIRQHPERFDMSNWLEGFTGLEGTQGVIEKLNRTCTAVGCLAGTAVMLAGRKGQVTFAVKGQMMPRVVGFGGEKRDWTDPFAVDDLGARLLGLDPVAGEQAYMFHAGWWPCGVEGVTATDALEYLSRVIASGNVREDLSEFHDNKAGCSQCREQEDY